MGQKFYAYTNVPNDKALTHLADCSHCNHGLGRGFNPMLPTVNGITFFTKIKQGPLHIVRAGGVYSGAGSVPKNLGQTRRRLRKVFE